MLNAALDLAARGLPVFPIAAGRKAPPIVPDWPAKATCDEQQIRDWWLGNIETNIGVHCAGLIVVDVDLKSGGGESFARLELVEGWPGTLTANTPSGGMHLFYRAPHPVKNGVSVLGPGLDIRSDHGYVVGVGSRTPAGEYTWAADVPIADAPAWVVQKLEAFTPREHAPQVNVPDAPRAAVERAAAWLAGHPGAVEGQGGDAHTYATACRLRDFGLSEVQAYDLLAGEWNETCSPPWSGSELAQKIRNAFRYAQEAAGVRLATADDFPPLEEVRVAGPMPKPAAGPMRLLELSQRASGRQPYLVKGVLNRGSHAVLYGAPGQGKTFVALDLAYHVAAGRDWQGHRVRPGLALYLAFEGVGGLTHRAAALVRHYGQDDVPLYVQPADYNLREPAGRQALGALIASLPEKPTFIVIDTLARAMKGGDENSAQDMGALNDAVGALIAATGACVMLIHHSGKNKAGGARGSSALLGAIDTELEVDEGRITATKQRDLEIIDPVGFRLHPIMLGMDEDGDELMSCVVMPAAPPPADHAGKLRGNVRLAFEALIEMSPQNEPVHPEDWRAECEEFLPKTKGAMYQIRKRLVKAGVLVELADGKVQRKLE